MGVGKNDLVLTFGTGWACVFGWAEKAIVKRNLETLPLPAPIDDTIIPEPERVVKKDYTIMDWSKFDYLDLEPRAKHYWIAIGVMVLSQGGFITYPVRDG